MTGKIKALICCTLALSCFGPSLVSASSVASCSMNGNFTHGTCWTAVCCDGGGSVGKFWRSGIPSSAEAICSMPAAPPGQPAISGHASSDCDANTIEAANKMTLTAMAQKSASAGGYPVGGAQCRYDAACEGDK